MCVLMHALPCCCVQPFDAGHEDAEANAFGV